MIMARWTECDKQCRARHTVPEGRVTWQAPWVGAHAHVHSKRMRAEKLGVPAQKACEQIPAICTGS